MPIYPRGKSFQVKLLDPENAWITRTFRTRREAELWEAQMKAQKLGGKPVLGTARQPSLDEYFEQWFEAVKNQASNGWRDRQRDMYKRYVSPILGECKIQKITPPMIARVLNEMREKGLAENTQLHAYALLRKMMRDAMELFMLVPHSPVLRSMRPKIPVKEARHLQLDQLKALLDYVAERPYGLGIWLQAFLGLRVGELQALTWDNVDLKEGTIRICRNYIRKEDTFREYPKGRRHHSHRIPPELHAMLVAAKAKSKSALVVTATDGQMLRYEWYNRSLQRYCRELKLPVIGTHGLRHSTAELYMANGATADDLRRLFAHSSQAVTDRYLHNRGTRLDQISSSMRIFGEETPSEKPEGDSTTKPGVTEQSREELSQIFPNDAQCKVIAFRRRS